MKDLDFDELDKAVNSLMEKAPKDVPAPAKEKETVVTLPDSTLPDTPKPADVPSPSVATTPAPEPEKKPDEPAAATPPAPVAAKRSTGRFMDVVHPSSDMRAPTRPSSRTGNTLQPLNKIDPAEPAAAETTSLPTPDPVPTPAIDMDAALNETPADTTAQQPGSWPDPIELQQPAPAEASETPAAETPETDSPTPEPTAPASDSPFLPGAKVEKRPLGGPTSEPITADSAPMEDPTASDKQADVPPKAAEPMPAELGSDVLAIEAGHATPTEESGHDDEPAPQLEGATTTPAPQPAGPVSISPQYKPQESSGDPSHAALYDTAADSHALTHPPKKKSGWLVVIAIIVLILLGAGGAAFVYFSDII